MKLLPTLFLAAFFAFSSFAQTNSPTWNTFLSDLQKAQVEYSTHYSEKKYQQAATVLSTVATTLDNLKLTEKEKQEFQPIIKDVYANVYYNLACLQSLLNEKKQAITSFEKAIVWGYKDYQNALNDTDLTNIRKEKKFIKAFSQLKQYDKLFLLQQSGKYISENKGSSLPAFNYQTANDHNLKEVKRYFNLDSIAGKGDEVSKIINIMLFVTNSIKYDGTNWALCEFDAIDFYNYHKATGKGINCRHKAMTLNEMYLAMGFKSRYVTCMPKDDTDTDCHVINSVYSETLKKWLWMDPSHGAYVMDENNNLLSIEEVRERLISNQSLKLNTETKVTKIWYLDNYMAKNLYWIQCTNKSQFNTESRYRQADTDLQYISLIPTGFDKDSNKYLKNNAITHDPAYFWKSPEVKN
ncbi:hypothetical protein ABH942_002274 [Flavobacterium sp. 28YEA47A]|uniref:transglutaminase-like domain-containing protein n=1 Tax=Flavobacterium sp. 28YEA47A TaxID=3156276 RepID=UPI003517947C